MKRSWGKETGRRYPGVLQVDGRPMNNISFDGHLIDAALFGQRAWLQNGFFQHVPAISLSFDGYLMA